MDYKNIEELYLAVGVAGVIIVVFLAVFVYLIVSNNNKTVKEMKDVAEKVSNLQNNDSKFETLMQNLTVAVKELSTTNRTIADTINKLDYYNRDLHRKVEKHDEKADKIYDELLKNKKVI